MVDATVLIVGCGPTGLIVAHELLRRGISCRLVDKRPAPQSSTRAFTVHARTMEMFDHIGIAHRVEEVRAVCPGNLFHFKGISLPPAQMPTLDFRRLRNTQYNYYGKVNQNDLDQILRDSLAANHSVTPEFDTECVAVKQEGDELSVRLVHGRGDVRRDEIVRPDWVIGADGSRSTVRRDLGLSFDEKETYAMTMSMVDVRLEGCKGDADWVNYYVADKGFMLLTSLPGNKFRMYLAGQLESYLKDSTPRDAFQKGLDFFDTGARIIGLDWSSTWAINKVICDTYRKGRAILCGDATHVHSPAGGQGMNACMQDAFNLGWKLSLVIKGLAPESILDTYQQERQPIAEQVTEGANRMHQVLFNANVDISDRYRLTQDQSWHDEAIYRISGLSHNYDRGTTGNPPLLERIASVEPGIRAADVVISEVAPRRRLYDIFRHTDFTLLLLPGDAASDADASFATATAVKSRYDHHVKCAVISRQAVDGLDCDRSFEDPLGSVRKAYRCNGEGKMVLVRPDLYVDYVSSLDDFTGLSKHMRQHWLT
jgi:2-polyprenyl-6-methoxyphenol hydroxylase-like FAD-dependent oxidoreductase